MNPISPWLRFKLEPVAGLHLATIGPAIGLPLQASHRPATGLLQACYKPVTGWTPTHKEPAPN